MLAAVSDSTWTFLGVLITNVVILVGLFVRQGKQGTKVEQINRAVNHQPAGSPTLVDRVGAVEKLAADLASDTAVHRDWERQVFIAIADEIGVKLPPLPKKVRAA